MRLLENIRDAYSYIPDTTFYLENVISCPGENQTKFTSSNINEYIEKDFEKIKQLFKSTDKDKLKQYSVYLGYLTIFAAACTNEGTKEFVENAKSSALMLSTQKEKVVIIEPSQVEPVSSLYIKEYNHKIREKIKEHQSATQNLHYTFNTGTSTINSILRKTKEVDKDHSAYFAQLMKDSKYGPIMKEIIKEVNGQYGLKNQEQYNLLVPIKAEVTEKYKYAEKKGAIQYINDNYIWISQAEKSKRTIRYNNETIEKLSKLNQSDSFNESILLSANALKWSSIEILNSYKQKISEKYEKQLQVVKKEIDSEGARMDRLDLNDFKQVDEFVNKDEISVSYFYIKLDRQYFENQYICDYASLLTSKHELRIKNNKKMKSKLQQFVISSKAYVDTLCSDNSLVKGLEDSPYSLNTIQTFREEVNKTLESLQTKLNKISTINEIDNFQQYNDDLNEIKGLAQKCIVAKKNAVAGLFQKIEEDTTISWVYNKFYRDQLIKHLEAKFEPLATIAKGEVIKNQGSVEQHDIINAEKLLKKSLHHYMQTLNTKFYSRIKFLNTLHDQVAALGNSRRIQQFKKSLEDMIDTLIVKKTDLQLKYNQHTIKSIEEINKVNLEEENQLISEFLREEANRCTEQSSYYIKAAGLFLLKFSQGGYEAFRRFAGVTDIQAFYHAIKNAADDFSKIDENDKQEASWQKYLLIFAKFATAVLAFKLASIGGVMLGSVFPVLLPIIGVALVSALLYFSKNHKTTSFLFWHNKLTGYSMIASPLVTLFIVPEIMATAAFWPISFAAIGLGALGALIWAGIAAKPYLYDYVRSSNQSKYDSGNVSEKIDAMDADELLEKAKNAVEKYDGRYTKKYISLLSYSTLGIFSDNQSKASAELRDTVINAVKDDNRNSSFSDSGNLSCNSSDCKTAIKDYLSNKENIGKALHQDLCEEISKVSL